MTAPKPPSVRDVVVAALSGGPAGVGRHAVAFDDADGGLEISPVGAQVVERLADRVVAALKASQPDHLLHFGAEGWTMQHSMDCRLEGRLIECPVNEAAMKYFAVAEETPQFGWRFVVDVDESGDLQFLVRVCKVCGCTDTRACPGGCSWAAPGVCTECVGKAAS